MLGKYKLGEVCFATYQNQKSILILPKLE